MNEAEIGIDLRSVLLFLEYVTFFGLFAAIFRAITGCSQYDFKPGNSLGRNIDY